MRFACRKPPTLTKFMHNPAVREELASFQNEIVWACQIQLVQMLGKDQDLYRFRLAVKLRRATFHFISKKLSRGCRKPDYRKTGVAPARGFAASGG